KHMIVIGGGVIGLEMGSVWSRVGAKVSVIEAMPKLLGNMDGSISKAMTKLMTDQGLELHVGTKVTGVEVKGGKATVTAETSDGTVTFEGDKVLVAVGRRAYTDGLNLEAVGIEPQRNGKIPVNEHLQTSVPHIYAIGDVI